MPRKLLRNSSSEFTTSLKINLCLPSWVDLFLPVSVSEVSLRVEATHDDDNGGSGGGGQNLSFPAEWLLARYVRENTVSLS